MGEVPIKFGPSNLQQKPEAKKTQSAIGPQSHRRMVGKMADFEIKSKIGSWSFGVVCFNMCSLKYVGELLIKFGTFLFFCFNF